MSLKDLAQSMAIHPSAPATAKVDKLHQYNAHRNAWWGSTVDVITWRAEQSSDTPEEQTLHILLSAKAVLGSLERC